VANRLSPGWQQLQRCHRHIVGAEMRDIESIIDAVLRTAQARGLVERAKRAAFDRSRRTCRAFALLGNDRNHAAKRIGAIETALRSSEYLDLLDIRGQQLAEVEHPGGVAGIADVDAVDQDFGMV